MFDVRLRAFLPVAALLTGVVASPAQAAIVDATITGGSVLGTASVVTLDASNTPFSVGDVFNTNDLYVFNERQNVALTAATEVRLAGSPIMLPAGTVVSSHLVAFGPGGTTSQSVAGQISFDSDILGFLRADSALSATNYLGLPGVTYLTPLAFGLEAGTDFVTVSGGTNLSFNLRASTPGDVFRVLTAGSATAAIPEPSVWAMMVIGFGTIGAAMRRRSGQRTDATA